MKSKENLVFLGMMGSGKTSIGRLVAKKLRYNFIDTDNDGVSDDIDKCSDTSDGADVDENGCSDSQKDTDGDGVTDDVDNCILTINPDQADSDGDSIGNVCDNCSGVYNPDQMDWMVDRNSLVDYIVQYTNYLFPEDPEHPIRPENVHQLLRDFVEDNDVSVSAQVAHV